MEQCHRKVILDNIDNLMACTEYDSLLKMCVEAQILSPVMRNIIEETGNDKKAKHRALFTKLTKRGPTAYNALVSVLEKLNCLQAAKILRPGEYSRNKFISIKNVKKQTRTFDADDENDAMELEPFEDESPVSFPVKKSNKIHYDTKIPSYSMKSRYRGVFFLVNIIDFGFQQDRRNGSDIDANAMIHLFRQMGFTIFYYENLYQAKFYQLLDKLLDSKYTDLADCFVMCIMSHGSMERGVEKVEFYGGSVEDLDNILDRFKNNFCRNLVGKPKIFIFPFCRGKISDTGVSDAVYYKITPQNHVETDHREVKMPQNIPTYSDILICYASVPGFKTHREPETGSWYVQTLCKVFAEYAHDTNLEDLLKIVGDQTGNIRTTDSKLQTASHVNYGFYRKLYFNPGYFED